MLWNRSICCGAEEYILGRDTCCDAEVYIVEQSRGNFCFAEVHIYILEELKHIVGHLWFM